MEFLLLEEEEFKKFADNHTLKTFMQTPSIAHLRKKSGWDYYYVGVKKDSSVVAASLLVSRGKHFSQTEFYAPRGLLVDYKDKKLLTYFVNNLKTFIKSKNGYTLRIDPYYIKIERDINGDIVEGGIDNRDAIDNLLDLGFKKSSSNEQISWSFCLDLDQKLDVILKNMRSFTRRSINKASKNHIIIRDVDYEDLETLKNILDATCERKNFSNRKLAYFQDMYNFFKKNNEIKFVIADIHLKELLDSLNLEIEEENKTIDDMVKKGSTEKKISVHKDNVESVRKRIVEIEKDIDKYGDIVAASAGVFITYGDEVLYLFGGNIEEFMHFGTPHFVQWEMIKYAKENNFKRYNFYGISGIFDKKDPSYGIYDFKKGYTGYVEELIGEYELPVNSFYYIFKIINKIRK